MPSATSSTSVFDCLVFGRLRCYEVANIKFNFRRSVANHVGDLF